MKPLWSKLFKKKDTFPLASVITYQILMHRLNVNVPEKEMEILRQYCEQEGRTQSDVLREYIRSLKRKLNKRIESSQ